MATPSPAPAATESPATESPATDSPASESPASESPASESPASESPATASSATGSPPKKSNQGLLDAGIIIAVIILILLIVLIIIMACKTYRKRKQEEADAKAATDTEKYRLLPVVTSSDDADRRVRSGKGSGRESKKESGKESGKDSGRGSDKFKSLKSENLVITDIPPSTEERLKGLTQEEPCCTEYCGTACSTKGSRVTCKDFKKAKADSAAAADCCSAEASRVAGVHFAKDEGSDKKASSAKASSKGSSVKGSAPSSELDESVETFEWHDEPSDLLRGLGGAAGHETLGVATMLVEDTPERAQKSQKPKDNPELDGSTIVGMMQTKESYHDNLCERKPENRPRRIGTPYNNCDMQLNCKTCQCKERRKTDQ